MLLIDKMKNYPFSPTEKVVVDYILQEEEKIKDYSTKQIGEATYTSPSILIRIAKKLDYKGWNDLKEDYLKELAYLKQHFKDIDANIPFENNDTIMNIAYKITSLYKESAEDTQTLVTHDSLQQAVGLMRKSQRIYIYAVANLNFLAQNFAYKLRKIGKDVYIDPTQDNMFHDAVMMREGDIALCLSYSGETPTLLHTVDLLKRHQVPIIAITSIGNNALSRQADVTLNVTTREKSFSKIGSYSSETSFMLVMDILYSCYFSLNYNENYQYKLKVANELEHNRAIENPIIEEETEQFYK